MVELFDSHAHLNLPDFERDIESVIQRAKKINVTRILNVAIDVKTSIRALELAHQYDGLYAALGIHPHEIRNANKDTYETLKVLFQDPKVVAIGEIGLDYAKEYSPRSLQQEHFLYQLSLAKEFNLPVIIHSRDASPDVINLLKQELPKRFVFHCYTGSVEEAKEILDLGGYISITGIVTFSKAENVRRIVRFVPIERLFIETDCPFLTPVPYRGKRNEPAFVKYVAESIAKLKNISFEECAYQTTKNACQFFGI